MSRIGESVASEYAKGGAGELAEILAFGGILNITSGIPYVASLY